MIKSKLLLVKYNYPLDGYLDLLAQKEKEIQGAFKAGAKCDYSITLGELGWVLTLKLFV
jgi:hypothetical protein